MRQSIAAHEAAECNLCHDEKTENTVVNMDDFNQIHKKYQAFFALGKGQYSAVFYIALDTEYKTEGKTNKLLSYQIATTSEYGTNNIILYMKPGERKTLAELGEAAIRSVVPSDMLAGLRGPILINVICHFSMAEWSALKDRDEPHIVTRLSVIRKSPVTGIHPINIVLNKQFVADVHIYDTKLLAPAAYQSLKKLSDLLGPDDRGKAEITDEYIRNMDQYLWDYPEEYKEYALRDSEVTLKLFLLLQECLNMLSTGRIEKLYKTLASAAVAGFLQGKKKSTKNT